MAQRSVEDSLSVEAGENAWVLIVSYLLMFLYVALVLGKPCHPIRYVFCMYSAPFRVYTRIDEGLGDSVRAILAQTRAGEEGGGTGRRIGGQKM